MRFSFHKAPRSASSNAAPSSFHKKATPSASSNAAPSLYQNDLLQEFKAICAADSALQPLLSILTLAEHGQPGSLDRFNLLNLLIKFVRSDHHLHETFTKGMPHEVHQFAIAHASPSNDRSNNLAKSIGQIDLPPSPPFAKFKRFFAEQKRLHKDVVEADGKPMWHIPGLAFKNWGLTVSNNPSDSFVARTVVGVQNLVKWAKKQGKTVRLAGYRHTWSDFYSSDNQILLMLIPLSQATSLPSVEPNINPHSEFEGITLLTDPATSPHPLVAIKSGTTNEQFRRWCLANKRVCLPFNVIMVEITFGGSNAPICHGAGLSTSTLSDLVAEVRYVDANGVLQTVFDPKELRAAAGCFGLLGPVTQLTLRVDRMYMAVMNPVKVRTALAIPPPDGYPIPKEVDMTGVTSQMMRSAREVFVKRCERSYYLEWFWFPYQKEVWINTWERPEVAISQNLAPYPSTFEAIMQWLENHLAETIINWPPWQKIPGHLQAYFFGLIAMVTLPHVPDPKNPIKAYGSEALHFRRGIQNMRCRNMEWEIPIPPVKGSNNRDYHIVQRAWWDAITLHYQRADGVMRIALEMRLTGSSQILLAPQLNNTLGTVSIEVLTTNVTPEQAWRSFMQQLTDRWTSYRSCAKGEPYLNARPHWAKEWQGLMVRGQPIESYLRKNAYKEERKEFVRVLEEVVRRRGGTLEETRKRFGNPLLERLFFQ